MELNLDMEPVLSKLVRRRQQARSLSPYSARSKQYVVDALTRFFQRERPGAAISGVQRMGGGASKEQFLFTLTDKDGHAVKLVLRMDPLEAITQTDRTREYEILNAVQGLVPAPKPVWIDGTGEVFGQPALIMEYVGGVAKPTNAVLKVSGLGTYLGERLRAKIRGQFLDHLVSIHGLDWRKAKLASYTCPDADSKQAVRWTLNYWSALWDIDGLEQRPIFSYARQWLEDNKPDCAEWVMTHGDYRTGNYLFDEQRAEITALLDWELARIGDFHEDIAWVLTPIFATFEDGVFRASDLFGRDEFIDAYETASGRSVNRDTLHYYEVLASYKTYIIVAANGLAVARAQHNHQDVLLTFLGTTHAMFASELCRLLSKGSIQ